MQGKNGMTAPAPEMWVVLTITCLCFAASAFGEVYDQDSVNILGSVTFINCDAVYPFQLAAWITDTQDPQWGWNVAASTRVRNADGSLTIGYQFKTPAGSKGPWNVALQFSEITETLKHCRYPELTSTDLQPKVTGTPSVNLRTGERYVRVYQRWVSASSIFPLSDVASYLNQQLLYPSAPGAGFLLQLKNMRSDSPDAFGTAHWQIAAGLYSQDSFVQLAGIRVPLKLSPISVDTDTPVQAKAVFLLDALRTSPSSAFSVSPAGKLNFKIAFDSVGANTVQDAYNSKPGNIAVRGYQTNTYTMASGLLTTFIDADKQPDFTLTGTSIDVPMYFQVSEASAPAVNVTTLATASPLAATITKTSPLLPCSRTTSLGMPGIDTCAYLYGFPQRRLQALIETAVMAGVGSPEVLGAVGDAIRRFLAAHGVASVSRTTVADGKLYVV